MTLNADRHSRTSSQFTYISSYKNLQHPTISQRDPIGQVSSFRSGYMYTDASKSHTYLTRHSSSFSLTRLSLGSIHPSTSNRIQPNSHHHTKLTYSPAFTYFPPWSTTLTSLFPAFTTSPTAFLVPLTILPGSWPSVCTTAPILLCCFPGRTYHTRFGWCGPTFSFVFSPGSSTRYSSSNWSARRS